MISLVNGQPVGYKKPGRPVELARHHTAAQNVNIRHNTFVLSGVIAKIDKRKYAKDRSVLAHDITFSNNLIVPRNNWQLISEKSYAGVSWLDNAFANISDDKKVKLPKNNHVLNLDHVQQSPKGDLPRYLLLRYGSHISNRHPIARSEVGPSWSH